MSVWQGARQMNRIIGAEDWKSWKDEQAKRVVEMPSKPELPEGYAAFGRSVNQGRYLDDREHFCDQAAIESLEHTLIACELIPLFEKLEKKYGSKFQLLCFLPICPGEEEEAYIKIDGEKKPCRFPEGIRKAMWQIGATTLAAGKYHDEPGFAITYSTYKRQVTQIVSVYAYGEVA